MTPVINTLFPVFAIIGIAYFLARKGKLTRGFMNELNWFIFWISLPALILHSLITASSLPKDTLPILVVFFASTLLVIGLSFAACRILNLQKEKIGTFIQSAFRGNLAYIGLPILIFALHGEPKEVVSGVVAQTMFVLAPSMLLYNGIAVPLLVGSKEGFSPSKRRQVLMKLVSNPLILASMGGILFFLFPYPLPVVLLNTLELIGQMAAPSALVCVGGAMAFVSMQGRFRSAIIASVLKVVLLPSLSLFLVSFIEIDPHARLVLLVLSACPTAVASYIMVKELDGDEALSAGSIVISTLLSIPVMALLLAFQH